MEKQVNVPNLLPAFHKIQHKQHRLLKSKGKHINCSKHKTFRFARHNNSVQLCWIFTKFIPLANTAQRAILEFHGNIFVKAVVN